MESSEFLKKMHDGLDGLSREAIVRFAGVSAIRALPYLGADGHFLYWMGKKMRRRNLYAALYAIDCNLSDPSTLGDIHTAMLAANAAASDAAAFSMAANAASQAAGPAAAAASADDEPTVTPAYTAAIAAAAAHAAANAVMVVYDHCLIDPTLDALVPLELTDIALKDLENIRNGTPLSDTDTGRYGPVWNNFRLALSGEGCAWWGRLYERLFADRFEPDLDLLRRRMTLPTRIRLKGAKAVASAMERLEERI
jgi:hypothetical protein